MFLTLPVCFLMQRYVGRVSPPPPSVSCLLLRESIYRLLPQTTPDNISKNFEQYSIDPATRYPNLNASYVRPHQVSPPPRQRCGSALGGAAGCLCS